MKTILVVAIDEDGEHDIRCGQVEERFVQGLLACDGLCQLDGESLCMGRALESAIAYDRDDERDFAEYHGLFDGCEVAPGAGLPAVDHVIRFYTV